MSSSTPQNAHPAPDGSDRSDAQRNPLGFADVRAIERPTAADVDAANGVTIGFAPREAATGPTRPEPMFRTEISFRRDHRIHTAVRAEGLPGSGQGGSEPELGRAEIHTFDLDAVDDSAPAAADEVWFDEPADDGDRVPFYKREITFGKKKEAPVKAVAAVKADDEQVPFYKREISFGRKKEQPAVAAAPAPAPEAAAPEVPAVAAVPDAPVGADDQMPFYKRELSFKRRRATVAAVEPQPAHDEMSFRDEPVAAVEPEPVFADEPVMVEEPLVAEQPVLHEEPILEADPVAVEEPLVLAEEPVAIEPVAVEEPLVVEDVPVEAFASSEVAAPVDEPVFFDEPVVAQIDTFDTIDTFDMGEPVAELVDDAPMFFDEEPAVADVAVEDVHAVADAPATDEIPVAHEVHAEQPVEVAFDEPAEAGAVEDAAGEVAASTKSSRKGGSVRLGRGGGAPKPKKAKKSGPKGRGKKILGLKIGASQIAAAVTQESGGRHELLQLVRLPIEAGLVVDGEVKDVDRLAEILKAFVEEHDLPRGNVRIGLASNRIGVRTVEITGIDDQERFDNAVRFKAHEVLPVAFNESVLDYRVVEERPIESGETSKRVLLVVAPRDQVQPYVDLCTKAGLRLTGIDLEALGLLRTFVEAHPIGFRAGDDTATVVVALGHESTTLLVAGGGVCDFTRVFDWGGETLQNAIATELDVDQAEAATILKHLSITGRGSDLDTLTEDQRLRANEAIRTRLTPFARELVSSLQFYQTQPDSLGIGEIVITGGTAHLSGLSEALHQMIGVSVRFGDPLARLVSLAEIPDALNARIGSMAVPIGLAIEDAPWRSVNLLPSELRNAGRRKPNILAVAAPAVAAVSIFALGFSFVGAHGDASDAQKALDDVKAQIAALPEPTGPTIDPALQAAQVARAQSVASVLGGRLAWEPFFRDLGRALPANVWLEHVQAEVPDAATAVPVVAATNTTPTIPTGVTIDGYTYSQADVALLLARLQAIPSLKNVTLKSARHEEKGESKKVDVVNFSILADLNGGAQ